MQLVSYCSLDSCTYWISSLPEVKELLNKSDQQFKLYKYTQHAESVIQSIESAKHYSNYTQALSHVRVRIIMGT